MKYTQGATLKDVIHDIANRLIKGLQNGKRILWFVPGGSNIKTAVSILDMVKANISEHVSLKKLTVTLTDERYGPAGHPDSNWQQLIEAGFDMAAVSIIPVLHDADIHESTHFERTVETWRAQLEQALSEHDFSIGFFGMGADGHIAGILPHTIATSEHKIVCGYTTSTYTRITITSPCIKKLNYVFVAAFGSTKKEQIERLLHQDIALDEQPVQVIKQAADAVLFTD
jgi:6-phosphogluconolactonase